MVTSHPALVEFIVIRGSKARFIIVICLGVVAMAAATTMMVIVLSILSMVMVVVISAFPSTIATASPSPPFVVTTIPMLSRLTHIMAWLGFPLLLRITVSSALGRCLRVPANLVLVVCPAS